MSGVIHILLPPNHLIDHAGVGLDEFYDFGADVFVGVGWDWDAVVTVLYHLDSYVNRLKKIMLIYSCEDEAALVESLWTLG